MVSQSNVVSDCFRTCKLSERSHCQITTLTVYFSHLHVRSCFNATKTVYLTTDRFSTMQDHSTSTDSDTALYNELFGTESDEDSQCSLFGPGSDGSSEGFEDKRNGDEADDEEDAVGQIECVQGPVCLFPSSHGDVEMKSLDDNSDDNSCRSNGQYSFQLFPILVQLISIESPT